MNQEQKKQELLETYRDTLRYIEILNRQVDHLDNYVDLPTEIYHPLRTLNLTVRSFYECLDVSSEASFEAAFEYGTILQENVNILRNNLDYILSQGIDFLRIEGFDVEDEIEHIEDLSALCKQDEIMGFQFDEDDEEAL